MSEDTEDVESDVEQEEELEDADDSVEEETAENESDGDTADESQECAHRECTRPVSDADSDRTRFGLCVECFMPPRRVRCSECREGDE